MNTNLGIPRHLFRTQLPHLGEICRLIFRHQINMWTTRRLKVSSLSSGNPDPETRDKNNPRAATHTSSSNSLTDTEPHDEHTPIAHPCPYACAAASRCGWASSRASYHVGEKLEDWPGCGCSALWWYKDLLGLVVTSSHLSLLLYCSYINLTPKLPPLPSSPWSCPPCSFPPVLAFLSLLFIFSLYPHSKTSFPPLPTM